MKLNIIVLILSHKIHSMSSDLNQTYLECLEKYFGYTSFREGQQLIIESLLEHKRDVLCIVSTGGGKSLCYQLPALISGRTVLVVSPLLSLMEDQCHHLDLLGIKSCCYCSTTVNKSGMLDEIISGIYSLVYITPESLVTNMINFSKCKNLCLIAIDEAHCISLWGNTFRESYLYLHEIKKWFPNVPVLALTGTATPKTEVDIVEKLKLNDPIIVKTSPNRSNLKFIVKHKTTPERDLHPLTADSCIIYCQTRKDTEKICEMLIRLGNKCEPYHAGLSTDARSQTHIKFMKNEITIIVATICFGMGIDKSDIRTVIHYGCPKDIESYYQEVGRAGRDGQPSTCIVYFTEADFQINQYFLQDIQDQTVKRYKEEMFIAMKKYLYHTECRRQYILQYFQGTPSDGDLMDLTFSCDYCCDNCNNQTSTSITKTEEDVTDFVVSFMKLVNTTKFGKTILMGILIGSKSAKIPQPYKTSISFGKFISYKQDDCKQIIQQIICKEYLQEIKQAGAFVSYLHITPKGYQWLNNPTPPFTIQRIKVVPSAPLTSSTASTASSAIIAKPTVTVKTKTVREKGKLSHEVTYDYYKEGKSVAEIAKIRNLVKTTIESHIYECILNGLDINMEEFGVTKEVFNHISKFVVLDETLDVPQKLSEIKAQCDSTVSYLQIKCVKALMEKKITIKL